MLATIAIALSVPTESYRLAQQAAQQVKAATKQSPTCACSETGVVDGVDTGKPGCAEHFGQRFGHICYVENGENCEGARLSRRTQVYWRSCRQEHLTAVAEGHLRDAMNELDVENLRTVIQIARDRGVDAATIAEAEERVDQQIQMVAARDELMEALDNFDAERLRAALEAAEELELDEHLSDDVMERSVERFEFLRARQASEEALRTAIGETNLPDLQAKLRDAQTKHCSHEVIAAGQDRVRELTRLMAGATEELNAAMLTRDATRIAEARTAAMRLHAIDSSVVREVSNRLTHLRRMEQATEALRAALADTSLSLVQATLTAARDLDAYPNDLAQGDARVAELTQMNAAALERLVSATAGHNAAELMAAIAHAETLDTGRDHADAVAAGNARLELLSQKDVARARLEEAMQGVDLEDIQEKLAWAEDLGVDPAVCAQAQLRISAIAQMRIDARSTLEGLVTGDDLMGLETALEEAQRLSATDDALTASANERLAVLTRRQDAKDDLQAAMTALDRADLEAKIVVARELGVDEPTLHEAHRRSRELEHEMHRAARHLHRDIDGDDYEKLRDSMADAASYNGAVTEEQMEQARARLGQLEEIYHREQDLRNAFDTTSMGHIQHMLQRCREVGCSNQVLGEGEAAASVLRNRMARAEANMIRLTAEATNAQELRDAIAEVRLLNAAAWFRIEAAEAKVGELEAR